MATLWGQENVVRFLVEARAKLNDVNLDGYREKIQNLLHVFICEFHHKLMTYRTNSRKKYHLAQIINLCKHATPDDLSDNKSDEKINLI